MKEIAIFRCDASLEIGTGHVMRCRALSKALRQRDVESVFICRSQDGDLLELLESEYKVLVLSEIPENRKNSFINALEVEKSIYGSWLGCTEIEDANETLELISNAQLMNVRHIVVDHYGLGRQWEQKVVEELTVMFGLKPKLLAIDDLANREHCADILLDANRLDPAELNPYKYLLGLGANHLLGPGYALLDAIYPALQPLSPIRSQLSRVMIFFGGVDKENYTRSALSALSEARFLHVAVDVVLGKTAIHYLEIKELALQRPNTNFHCGLPALAGIILRADLAIGGAGTNSWERACLGLPSLAIAVADNQRQGAHALAKRNAVRYIELGSSSNAADAIFDGLVKIQESPVQLQEMSNACLSIGDGKGIERVTRALLGPISGLNLRSASLSDKWIYYWWANDSDVRQQSFNQEFISMEGHEAWFINKLGSSSSLLYVLEDGEHFPLGQIRFDRMDDNDVCSKIGFSLSREARGRGLASSLLQMGVAQMSHYWRNSMQVYGEVRAGNDASCRAFQRSGFQEDISPRPGVRCFKKEINPTI